MNRGPGPELLADPRFDEVYARALKKFGLSQPLGEPVRRLVGGTADPRTFTCCGSGCIPCAKDYLGAAEMVVVALARPVPRGTRKKRWFFF